MIRLVLSEPEDVKLSLVSRDVYPREMRLHLAVRYTKAMLEINTTSKEEYDRGFYLFHPHGEIELINEARNVNVKISAEISGGRIGSYSLNIYSKPLSREDIYEIDEKLRPDDIEVRWSIDAWGVLEEKFAKQHNIGLIPIFIGTVRRFRIPRKDFVRNVLEKADLLRREFIEVVVEPIDLDHIKDSELRSALQFLLEKQRLLLEVKEKLAEAKTASDFRGVIGEVRRAVEIPKEWLERLRKLCEEAYRKLNYIVTNDPNALKDAPLEMASTIVGGSENIKRMTGLLEVTYYYASRFGIHTKTLSGSPYTPIPTRMEAEFAIQQALIGLNYLIRLLSRYTMQF